MDYNYSTNQESNQDSKTDAVEPNKVIGQTPDSLKGDIPANPLLPKLLYPEWRQPVNCPLDGVRFV